MHHNNQVMRYQAKQPIEAKQILSLSRPPRNIQQITDTLKMMDESYSAVFGSWIKKQENLPASIAHLCRVANEYPLHQIILVLQWLIVDWKLKSIIVLVTNVTIGWKDEKHLGLLVKGLAEKWKPAYISELVLAVIERWDPSTPIAAAQQERFLIALMRGWNFNQISNVLLLLENRIPWQVKASIFKWFQRSETNSTRELNFAASTLFRNNRHLLSIPQGNERQTRQEDSGSAPPMSSPKQPMKSPIHQDIVEPMDLSSDGPTLLTLDKNDE